MATVTRRGLLLGGLAATLGSVVPACGTGSDDGVGPDGRVTISLWHGQAETAREAIERLVADFERAHPGIHVDLGGGGVIADAMLQKVLAALAAGSYPDIAYIFGSDLASVARSPQVVDLTGKIPSWEDFWDPVRAAVTINGQVRAAPAVLDSLAVVCNKTLFDEAGMPLPEAGWSWHDFTEAARKLTNVDKGVFGTGWPGAADEDTVWRLWPMIWDLGGDVIAPDGRSIGFAGTGERALQVIADLVRDKSVYIDPKPGGEQMYQVFQSGRMGMVPTGPWQLPDIVEAQVDYQVVPLPSFSGRPVTISGPDTWTLFDNGKARVEASRTFVNWLAEPEQDVRWGVEAGSLPLSRRTEATPEWRKRTGDTVGLDVFTHVLETARVRPVHPAYPQVSQALGQAIVAVLLGESTPADALRTCAGEANAALVIPR